MWRIHYYNYPKVNSIGYSSFSPVMSNAYVCLNLSEFRVGFTMSEYTFNESDVSATILVQASKKPEPNTSYTVQFHPDPGMYVYMI